MGYLPGKNEKRMVGGGLAAMQRHEVMPWNPLSHRGEKARLARHWHTRLGAPTPLASAGARSGGRGEGRAKPPNVQLREASPGPASALRAPSPNGRREKSGAG